MMKEQAVIILDCGATNIRAIAVNRKGRILRSGSFPNHTASDPLFKGGLVWDVRFILEKLAEAGREVCAGLTNTEIIGVCTTSFGVDGAPFDKDGNQLYPVISWACERTKDIVDEVHDIFPLSELHRITGLNHFHFNTLYKLYWLKKNLAEVFNKTDHWLFMPAIISGFLCQALYTDVSMAGTSMLCDRSTRRFSKDILAAFDLKADLFPPLKEAGQMLGRVTKDASAKTGIPAGVPVFAAGHDTQFAIFGSGAGVNEPVLSSGTWEILMVRTPVVDGGKEALIAGITTELDAVPGLYNPGLQWLASRFIEEFRKEHFADVMLRPDVYDMMIGEAEKAESSRGRKFYELLEDLSEKTKSSLHLLEKSCGFRAENLIVVGGGSKNRLWNKLRADALGIEIKTIPQSETTVLGAAKFAFAGADRLS